MPRVLSERGVTYVPAGSIAQAAAELLRSCKLRGQPDIVHAHMVDAEIVAVMMKVLVKRPIVATLHFARRRGRTATRRQILHWLPKAIDCQIAISEFVARQADQVCEVIPPGVPATPDTEGDGSEGRRPTVLVAQRFEEEKNTAAALDIWARSELASEGWELELAGSGREEGVLRVMASQLGIADSVRFVGFVDDLPRRMQRAGVLLATAPGEPFGLSVVEAMAARLPVVAARGGGHVETLEGFNAYLYGPHNPGEAAEMLRSLALDPRERARYGDLLLERYRSKYTMEAHTSRIAGVYEMVLRGRTR